MGFRHARSSSFVILLPHSSFKPPILAPAASARDICGIQARLALYGSCGLVHCATIELPDPVFTNITRARNSF
jgi:hypothetical protein